MCWPAPVPQLVIVPVAAAAAGFIGLTMKASRWMNYIEVSEEKDAGPNGPASSVSSVLQCTSG